MLEIKQSKLEIKQSMLEMKQYMLEIKQSILEIKQSMLKKFLLYSLEENPNGYFAIDPTNGDVTIDKPINR